MFDRSLRIAHDYRTAGRRNTAGAIVTGRRPAQHNLEANTGNVPRRQGRLTSCRRSCALHSTSSQLRHARCPSTRCSRRARDCATGSFELARHLLRSGCDAASSCRSPLLDQLRGTGRHSSRKFLRCAPSARCSSCKCGTAIHGCIRHTTCRLCRARGSISDSLRGARQLLRPLRRRLARTHHSINACLQRSPGPKRPSPTRRRLARPTHLRPLVYCRPSSARIFLVCPATRVLLCLTLSLLSLLSLPCALLTVRGSDTRPGHVNAPLRALRFFGGGGLVARCALSRVGR